jgi:hypothetical protein
MTMKTRNMNITTTRTKTNTKNMNIIITMMKMNTKNMNITITTIITMVLKMKMKARL